MDACNNSVLHTKTTLCLLGETPKLDFLTIQEAPGFGTGFEISSVYVFRSGVLLLILLLLLKVQCLKCQLLLGELSWHVLLRRMPSRLEMEPVWVFSLPASVLSPRLSYRGGRHSFLVAELPSVWGANDSTLVAAT